MSGYRPGEPYPGTEKREHHYTREIERITKLETQPADGFYLFVLVAALVLGFFWFDARVTTLEHSVCDVALVAGDSITGCVR